MQKTKLLRCAKILRKQHEYDVFRTEILSILNFKVLRFWNYEVLNNLEKVLQKIAEHINV